MNSNEPRFISGDVKNNIKLMAMEQSLYAQLFKLWRKYLQFVAAYKIKVMLNLSFRVNMKYHNYGLISNYIGLA